WLRRAPRSCGGAGSRVEGNLPLGRGVRPRLFRRSGRAPLGGGVQQHGVHRDGRASARGARGDLPRPRRGGRCAMNASALLVRGVEADALRSGALLAVRVVAGLAMALHGAPKMLAPFSWMGPEAPVPGLLQAAAAAAEFFGGIAWAVGLATPLASAGIVATMITAVFLGHVAAGDPLVRITVTGDPAGPGAAWGGLPTWLA